MNVLVILLPVAYAIFYWWFTTGAVMVVYGRSERVYRLYFAFLTAVMLAAFVGIVQTRSVENPAQVYLAFSFGGVMWGWQTASYYLGIITGPKQLPASIDPQDESLKTRFRSALYFSMYHEILCLIVAVILAAVIWQSENRWALWTYLTLWFMHSSAKLNVFLGVRNFHIEFLPHQLHHLGRLLTKRANNALFPFSVVVASSVALTLVYQAIMPGTDPAQTIGFVLIATMISLGVMEHWLMVLPIPSMIWGWGMKQLPEPPESEHKTAEQRSTNEFRSEIRGAMWSQHDP